MANIYLPRKNDLPEEKMILAGIFANYPYRNAKGVIEIFLEKLNIGYQIQTKDVNDYLPSHRIIFKTNGSQIGEFGVLENKNIYYEFGVEQLRNASKSISSYKPIPKYPPQIEDLTFVLPQKTKIGDVISSIKLSSKHVSNIELTNKYKDAYSFRVWYQNPKKTLTDKEVEKIRIQIIRNVRKKYGASLKN
jgi:phenylalanyl-tRNA synthetase beta chain